ncbi:MAG: protoheme IX farnesyltransferase [Deltaproteobacteria bacterium]|nr:protoheme IX farnesyltransferase [Deltaproteobacteria bacterium]MBW2416167.1 protoheme IX farnesyltransferase [Deltaproteobacteria bacterium]
MSTFAPYFQLTKPRLLPLVLFSGLPALVMAAGGWPDPAHAAAILGGIALAGGAANALNSYLERDKDALMSRTVTRPLPAGALDPRRALAFGLALGVAGPGLLWWTSGAPAALVALAGILFYVFVYTLWLKPRTPAAVIWGGVAGAISPLIADAAVDGRIGAAGWLVFAIVFAWQPPHFWAIAIYRQAEYEAADFPLLVSRIGPAATARHIVAWIAALVAVSLVPVGLGMLGVLYGVTAVALGAWFALSGVQLLRDPAAEPARRVFRVSLVYLMGIFAAMLTDLALHALIA